MSRRVRIVTYNVHKCRGLDRRVSPARIADVLKEIDADVIALQEVWSVESATDDTNQARAIACALGMDYRKGVVRSFNGGVYGNVILSRLPMSEAKNYDLTWRQREPRGCLRVDVEVDGERKGNFRLHVFNVHLGTAFIERRHQGRKLVSEHVLANAGLDCPRVILGDFNEWTRGLTSQLLQAHFRSVDLKAQFGLLRSYPGVFPFLHLDNIYYDHHLRCVRCALHRSRLALIASDHLPLVADFELLK